MNTFDTTLYIFAMLTGLAGFSYLLFLWILDVFILRTYQFTEAKVIGYNISQVPIRADKIEAYGYIYQLHVLYEYKVNDILYQSGKLNVFNNVLSINKEELEKLLYTKDDGKYIKVYVNQKKPKQVYAFPMKWRKKIVLLYMSLFLFGGLIMLFLYITTL